MVIPSPRSVTCSLPPCMRCAAIGITYTDDKLLQTRIFSYADTQRHRLGPNYLLLPVNAPKVRGAAPCGMLHGRLDASIRRTFSSSRMHRGTLRMHAAPPRRARGAVQHAMCVHTMCAAPSALLLRSCPGRAPTTQCAHHNNHHDGFMNFMARDEEVNYFPSRCMGPRMGPRARAQTRAQARGLVQRVALRFCVVWPPLAAGIN